jgi:release factor glutamine methyltransferase
VNTPTTWTVGALLDWTARFLAEKQCEFSRLDAEVLLAHALGRRRIDLYTHHDEIPTAEARETFRGLIRRRIEGCPVAYLVGRKEFFALDLEVSSAVLIPRPESEFVVMECLRLAKGMEKPAVLDIGTGSGNLAVAIAHQHAGAEVTAVDRSAAALEVAARNAAKHGVQARVRFLEGDLFEPLGERRNFDFVVSNPPYIATEDLGRLPSGVRDYEPVLALDGGPGGYTVLDRLIANARDYLRPGGHLIVEIGAPQEEHVRRQVGGFAGYHIAPTIYDYSRHPRVIQARWEP